MKCFDCGGTPVVGSMPYYIGMKIYVAQKFLCLQCFKNAADYYDNVKKGKK